MSDQSHDKQRISKFDRREVIRELSKLLAAWGNNQLYAEAREVVYKARSLLEYPPVESLSSAASSRIAELEEQLAVANENRRLQAEAIRTSEQRHMKELEAERAASAERQRTPESPKGEEAQVAGQATNGASGDNPGRCGSERTLADSKGSTCRPTDSAAPDESNRHLTPSSVAPTDGWNESKAAAMGKGDVLCALIDIGTDKPPRYEVGWCDTMHGNWHFSNPNESWFVRAWREIPEYER